MFSLKKRAKRPSSACSCRWRRKIRRYALSGTGKTETWWGTETGPGDRKRNLGARLRCGRRISPEHEGRATVGRWHGPLGGGLLLPDASRRGEALLGRALRTY